MMTANGHNKLLGFSLLAHGVILAVGVVITVVYFTTIIVAALQSNNAVKQMISLSFVLMAAAIAVAGIILVVPQIVGGWAVLWKIPSARGWGIAVSIFALVCLPIGTAIGIYGLWFLCSEDGRRFYSGGGNSAAFVSEQR